MSDPTFDSLMAQEQAAAGRQGPADPVFDELMEQEKRAQWQALATNLQGAVQVNPDQYSAQRRAASSLGYPVAAVEAKPDLAKQAQVQQVQQDASASPVLQRKYADPDFAKLAHDDSSALLAVTKQAETLRGLIHDDELVRSIDTLADKQMHGYAVEDAMRASLRRSRAADPAAQRADATSAAVNGEMRPWNGPAPTPANIVKGLLAALPQGFDTTRAGLNMQMGDFLRWIGAMPGDPVMEADERRKFDQANHASSYTDPDFESRTASAVYGGVSSLVRMLPATAASVLLRSPTPTLLQAGVDQQAQSYGEFTGRGASGGLAFTAATASGVVEALTELIPEKYFVESFGKVGVKELVTNFVKKEAIGEQFATFLEDAIDTATANPDKTWGQFFEERPGRAYETLVSTITQAGLMGTAGHVAERAAKHQLDEVNKANKAFTELQARINATKLADRSPEHLQALLHEATDGALARFDAAALMQTFEQAGLDIGAVLPSIDTQDLQRQAAAGGEVSAPLAEVATAIRGTPLEQSLPEHIRFGTNELSAAEAKQVREQLRDRFKKDFEESLAGAKDAEAIRQSAENVRQTLLEQLNTAGRYRAQVNEAMSHWAAAFYSTMSQRLGMTPEEMYARYPLRVTGEATGQGSTLNDSGKRPGALTVEGYHYSKAERSVISTGAFGTGLEGSGRETYLNAEDKRLRKRAYFYVDKGTGINPEAGVGGIGHKVTLSNVYDADADPLRLKEGRSQLGFESAVLDKGFSGYLSRMDGTQSGQVIMLGDQTFKPEVLGALGKTAGAVVPKPAARASVGRDQIVDALQAQSKNLPQGSPTRERWAQMLEKVMPKEYAALKDAGVFDGKNDNLYLSELVKEFRAKTEAPVYEQRPTSDAGHKRESNGRYVGAPDWVGKSPQKLAALRKKLEKLTVEGQVGRYWYEKSARAVLNMVGGDKAAAEKFIGLLAIYSQGTSVSANTTSALKAWYQWKAGEPITAGRFPTAMGKKAEAWLNRGEDWGGIKTNNFYTDLMEEIDPSKVDEHHSTMDMWMALAFDYGDTKLDQGPKYLFAQREIKRIADSMGWRPHQVQAAIWTSIKARVEGSEKERNAYEDKKGIRVANPEGGHEIAKGREYEHYRAATRFGMESKITQADIDASDYDFSDALQERTAQVSWEATPGASTGVLPGIHEAPMFQQEEYLAAIRKALADENGRDLIDARLGLMTTAGDQLYSGWQGQTSVGVQQRAGVTVENGRVSGQSRLLVQLAADIRGLVLSQEGMAWHFPVYNGAKFGQNGSEFTLGRTLTAEETSALYASLSAELGHSYAPPIPTVDGFRVLNFPDEKFALEGETDKGKIKELQKASREKNDAFHEAVLRAVGAQAFSQEVSNVTRFETDGELRENNWANGDADYRKRIGDAAAQLDNDGGAQASDLLKWVDDELRPRVEAVNKDFAERYGWDNPHPEQAGVLNQDAAQPLLAPNGKPSKLSAEHYALVRTPAFKNWFGDWEKFAGVAGGVWGDAAGEVSKVVDENGEPLVVYHGTDAAGFEEFNRPEGQRRGDYGIFASSDWDTAASYIRRGRAREIDLRGGGGGNVYAMFMNIRNPHEAYFEGANWDGQRAGKYQVDDEDGEPIYAEDGARYFDAREDAEALAEAHQGAVVNAAEDHYETTDGVAREARKYGNDGAIIHDVLDDGGGAVSLFNPATVYVAFEPEQLKSVQNFGEFDPTNPNLLAQGPRGSFNPKSLELVLSPTADLSTWFHESGHFYLEVLADIASQPNAPEQIADDVNKIMAWFGVEDLATWQAMSLDEKRRYHERFAESIEQYVMEGKAPSTELQPFFRRFRAWLMSVYKSLQSFLASKPDSAQTPLNDDIRRVMDRMLATDEQIQQANEIAGLVPNEEADAEASDRLQRRSMADLKWTVNARDKAIKALTKQAKEVEKGVRAQVTEEVNQMPEVQAKAKLDELRKAKQLDDASTAAVADAFGFESVDKMLQTIDAFGSKKDVIDAFTAQRMLEEHGDLVDERAIREAANEAVHNEARARSLATELRTQAELLNPRRDTGKVNAAGSRVTVNALVEAAKQFGQRVADNTVLRDLKSKVWQHTQAERRAGAAWRDATAKGDTQAAVKAKQDQMLQNAAAKATLEAQAEAKKVFEFFKRIVKGNDETVVEKGRDPDIVNAARAVLAAYGVETPTTKQAADYLELVKKNDPETYNVIAPSVEGALRMAQPLESLTVEQMRGLHEELQALWHLAKRSRQMEVDGNLMDIADAAGELHARMVEYGIPDTIPGETGALTNADKRKRWLQFAGALLRRVEQWSEKMDGKYGGPFLRYVFQPIKDAAEHYRSSRFEYRKEMQAIFDKVGPTMTHKLIEAPELGYTFGKGHNGIGHAELLHAILHTGNESNLRKLLLGRGWGEANPDGTVNRAKWDGFINRLVQEGVLTREHFDFAQSIWDLMEKTKPLAQRAHRDVFGRYFNEVTADAFVDPFGVERRGGYVPAQADPMLTGDADVRALAELENENMAYSFPATSKGFTKSRVEYNRPLKLDLRTLPQHIDKVLLFSHMEPAVRGATKLLRDKGVSQALNRIDPSAYSGMLLPWLNRSARQIVETPIPGDGGVSRVLSALRARAGAALMFGNISNSVQQITGFTSALVKVEGGHMMRAVSQFIAHPKQTLEAVKEHSEFMKNRADGEIAHMTDTIHDIILNHNLYEKSQAWTQRNAYFLQQAIDNTMGPIIWTAAYNQALEQGMEDRMAVRFADGVIRQTQQATAAEDVSRIETGPAYARLFTQFAGYFNMLANTNATALQQIAKDMGLRKGAGKALGVVFFGTLAPIWIAEAIAQAFKGGPDDKDHDGYLDDWLAAVFGMGTIKGVLAYVPFVGQLASAGIGRFTANPTDDKMSLSPAVGMLESSAGVAGDVYQAINGKLNAKHTVEDLATLVSLATGLPARFVARPLGYAAGVAQGKIEPTSPADAARGLATGAASPESRQR